MDGRFVITYLGALGVPQGFETALDGMALLQRHDQKDAETAALLLIGDGVRRKVLMEYVRVSGIGNVLFHEPIEKGSLGAVLAQSDACLLQLGALDNFKYGLSPNKLFDYFGAGKPVLIAAEYPTIVDEAHAGIRFRPGDPDGFR